jgi:hypothetical protein
MNDTQMSIISTFIKGMSAGLCLIAGILVRDIGVAALLFAGVLVAAWTMGKDLDTQKHTSKADGPKSKDA